MDKRIVREIIRDFHIKDLPPFTKRLKDFSLPEGKIRSLIGARRSGKTYVFFQLINELIESGIAKERILYINFEDERLTPLSASDLSVLYETYFELYPELKQKKIYLFFDEIQNIPQWDKFIRRVHDNENAQINITGSSSRLLSKELATALRGRTLANEIFPFNFEETLHFRNIEVDKTSSRGKAFIVNAFEEYRYWGGFPEILKMENVFKIRILQDYLNLVLYRDLIERHEIRNHALLKYLLKFLLANNANPFSVNKFYLDVRSQGFKSSKDSIFNYLNYLEDAFWFSYVSLYSESLRKRQVNYKKIYALDNGLVSATRSSILLNSGRLLESLVYQQLRRLYDAGSIFYYKTLKNEEVDFLVIQNNECKALIQVAETLTGSETRQRELNALYRAMDELNLNTGLIITGNEYKEFLQGRLAVRAVPYWDWALR